MYRELGEMEKNFDMTGRQLEKTMDNDMETGFAHGFIVNDLLSTALPTFRLCCDCSERGRINLNCNHLMRARYGRWP